MSPGSPKRPDAHKQRPERLAYYSCQLMPSTRANTIQVTAMCEAFQQIGVSTTLYAYKNPDSEPADDRAILEYYGIRTDFDMCMMQPPRRGTWASRLRAFSVSYRTCTACDLCVTRWMVPALACAIRGVPCIVEAHDYRLGRTDRMILSILRKSRTTRFVAISGTLANLLQEMWGIHPERLEVQHDGFRPGDHRDSQSLTIDFDLNRTGLRAVYVGSFYPGRGVDLIARLAVLHPDVDFLLVGATESDLEALRSSAGNVFVFPRVPHSSVPAILAVADILLLPHGKIVSVDSLGRGDIGAFCSPLKLFEYMASAKAILASRLPSIEEVLADGDNALLANPDDLADWSCRLLELKADASLRMRLGQSALAASADYAWPSRARRMLAASVAHD